MYIEKNTLLVKKLLGKKITSSLVGYTDIQVCAKMSKKLCDIWKLQESYISFGKYLFDTTLLEEILYEAIKIDTMLFFDNSISEGYNDKLINFAQRFIYESNKTEGSRISFEQLQLIFSQKKSGHKNKNEIQEVKNSIDVWVFLKDSFVFNEINIKKIYHKLTKGLLQENGEKYPRGYKKNEVIVNNSHTVAPKDVSGEMDKLLTWYKENKKNIFPLQLAFDFHLRFEQIHPFENGNGRIGRMLLNKILLANNSLPMIVFTDNRQSYFNSIASAEGGRKKKYYTFMLQQYNKTIEEYFNKK